MDAKLREMANTEFGALCARHPALASAEGDVIAALELISDCYHGGGKLLAAGNGGSAADAEHIVGELMKCFRLPRPVGDEFRSALISADGEIGAKLADGLQRALTAVSLCSQVSLSTAIQNDNGAEFVFAQELFGVGRRGDVLFAISTSGNSENIIYAAVTAKATGMKIVGLTGEKQSRLSSLADVCIRVPETETYLVQELHEPVYHFICKMLETEFFGETD